MKLISFDIQSDFAFFRKPETNNTINLSYNIIHRPAVLGLLGAIIGLDGYKEKGEMPSYYNFLGDLKIGIEPLEHYNGIYAKTSIRYSNTVGYANKGANFLTEELTLINPKYRIYLLLDMYNYYHNSLYDNLKKGESVYLPYFGKNEFFAWWYPDSIKEYEYSEDKQELRKSIRIKTLFQKEVSLKDNIEMPTLDLLSLDLDTEYFMFFERMPKGFDLELMQYDIKEFAYTNYLIANSHLISNLFYISSLDAYVYLF